MGKQAVDRASKENREEDRLIFQCGPNGDSYFCRVLLIGAICREIPGPMDCIVFRLMGHFSGVVYGRPIG